MDQDSIGKDASMPRNTRKTDGTPRRRNARSASSKKDPEQQQRRDQANTERFVDRSTEGLGIAAQDLPGAEHGQNVVDPPEQMTRNLPQQHGGEIDNPNDYEEGGLRGAREMSDADRKGGRKRN
jgi:hypothetical protein